VIDLAARTLIQSFQHETPARHAEYKGQQAMASEDRTVSVIQELFERTAPLTGEAFFRALTRGLAELINVDHCFIATAMDRPPTKVHVEASWYKGGERKSWDYKLAGNPCQLAYDGEVTFIPCDVGDRFESKKESGYQCFIGVPLRETNGDVIGHLAVYSSEALDPDGDDLRIAELFAARAEGEARQVVVENELQDTVKELARANETLVAKSTTDPLTGLFNREAFADIAHREFRRARRNGRSVAMIFIDLDHFKDVNDRHGHAVGNKVLVEVASVLRRAGRSDVDTQARIGSEEFVILVPEAEPEVTERVAASIVEAVHGVTIVAKYDVLRPTCSAGYAVIADDDVNWEGLLNRADAAMYRAKEHGRDRAVAA
jgi:diguanylate cyclase (GGDEF)-like protein